MWSSVLLLLWLILWSSKSSFPFPSAAFEFSFYRSMDAIVSVAPNLLLKPDDSKTSSHTFTVFQ